MAEENLDDIASLEEKLIKLFEASLKVTFPDQPNLVPIIAPGNKSQPCDYQCNNAMSLWAKIRNMGTEFQGPEAIGQAIMLNLPTNDIIKQCYVARPGYVNIILSDQWMAQSIHRMLINGIDKWAPKHPVKRAIVDFSSPNIAKQMHVGHLRSTIIGDCIARMLEFSKHEVLRRNHVGDWGTQFGMLLESLFEKSPNGEVSDQAIGDLEDFYRESKKRFDEDPEFKKRAQKVVVSLQRGEERYVNAWEQICEISRKGFEEVYERLGVHLVEKGESFYNEHIPLTLYLLSNLIEENEGAQVIVTEGKPLIVVKSDGGLEKAEWIIYVTDVGQKDHFHKFFNAAKLAGWLSNEGEYPKTSHVGFGLVCGDDGKRFRTRSSTGVVKLIDLLDEAKTRCKATLVERGRDAVWTDEQLEQTAEALGYGAVKYADLKNNRLTDYKFNYDQMLSDKGDTGVYLQYAHARICSILERSGRDIEDLKNIGQLKLEHDSEHKLGLHILRFPDAFEEACTNLVPHVLCEYLYSLAEKFSGFYQACQVIGTPEEMSRLLLCEATAVIMRKCFHLLGITPVFKL